MPTPPSIALPDVATRLYRNTTLREIEAHHASLNLMERAGKAAFDLTCQLRRGDAPILLLAGPGNNGGDALVLARLLHQQHVPYCCVLPEPSRSDDARNALDQFIEAGGSYVLNVPQASEWSLVVDGAFGIGLQRELAPFWVKHLQALEATAQDNGAPLLALDIPSGLDAETGITRGYALRATHTLSFIGTKPGLYTGDGPDHVGLIGLAHLGLENNLPPGDGTLLKPDTFRPLLQPRRRNTHKGSYGAVGVLGGGPSMTGALLIAARAALLIGSGRVFAAFLDPQAPSVDFLMPELMIRPPRELPALPISILAAGPGLGTSPTARDAIRMTLDFPGPLLLDADALNLIATESALRSLCASRPQPTLMTPHPAEAARLLDTTVSQIQSDRVQAALELATRFRAVIALKGCGTLVATPEGQWSINTTGHPGMAAPGMGDALTGLVAGLLAQGWPAWDALSCGVLLHGLAADNLSNRSNPENTQNTTPCTVGPIGLTASELLYEARRQFNAWISD